MKKLIFLIFMIFLLSGCQSVENTATDNQPFFIFSYALDAHAQDSIKPEHQEKIDEWLSSARQKKDENIYEYSLDGYQYYYAKGYQDAEVSFIYSGNTEKGNLQTTLFKGKKEDSVFVQIRYNTNVCCDGTGIEVKDGNKNTSDIK